MNLAERLVDLQEVPEDSVDEAFVDVFLDWATERGLNLYPAQEEALLELTASSHVILSTPTGSGKSLVAIAAHGLALVRGQRSFYTAPIKALVSEKFFSLCDIFGPDNVGMMTGDAAVNANAPIVCATAEIVANKALREGKDCDIDQVVMDEFHYYSEPDRGWAWQVPLLELGQCQFLLMSATLGDVGWLQEDLESRTGRPTANVTGSVRPVPLKFEYSMEPIHDTVSALIATKSAPLYIVHFTQADALERAQALTSITLLDNAGREKIARFTNDFRFTTSFGSTLSRLLKHGIGVHHAGMLPKYRRLVERLAQDGALPVICGTDTLGVGINVPIRTVVFTGLTKYDGRRQRQLKAREFHQIAGRAGRAGYDTSGRVVVQAPEYEIENAKAVAKAGDDPKKLKKLNRKKPPEGFVNWGRPTFEKLVAAEPETLTSNMRMTSSMLLNIIARPQSCAEVVHSLARSIHESRKRQNRLIVHTIELFRGLVRSGIVNVLDSPDETGRRAHLTVDLQRDFALDQPLSPFAVTAFDMLDKEDPTYALDLISIIEATLDDPRAILMAQRHQARGEAIGALKAEGIEYDERMERVEDITWPQPLAEELNAAFDIYRADHPWVNEFELSPKSVVRDMILSAMTFSDVVSTYKLAKSEGAVLRYLTSAYRALRKTVPTEYRTEELDDIVEWLGELVRQIDSSLLDEWEALTGADNSAELARALAQSRPGGSGEIERPVTANKRAFTVMIRNALFRRVILLARDDIAALRATDSEVANPPDWNTDIDSYWDSYDEIRADNQARGPRYFHCSTSVSEHELAVADLEEGDPTRMWLVRQILLDPEDNNDWSIVGLVDLDASDEAGAVRFASLRVQN